MAETVLVTGGAGFIGSFLVDRLVAGGYKVVVYDNLEPQVHAGGTAQHTNPNARYVHGDVRDRDRLTQLIAEADVISHQAAMVGVGQSMYQVDRYVDVNIRGTAVLLDVLANDRHHVRKVVVPGSMSAYGEGAYLCMNHGFVSPELRPEMQMAEGRWEVLCEECGQELDPVPTPEAKAFLANSVYAITKQAQEQLVLNVCKSYDIPAVALRYFNVFGPRQSLSNPYTGVAAIFLSQLKNDHQPLVFEDGLQTRDFISVHDIVAANIAAMEDGRADYGVFNIGTGRRLTIREVAETLSRLMGKTIEPRITGQYRSGDVRHCIADVTKVANTLDWAPQVTFEEGMKELVEWSLAIDAVDKVDQATEELKARGLLKGTAPP